MKVTCLLGSPRVNGNSTTIARKLCEVLEKADAEVQYIPLNKLNYKGCQACEACKKSLTHCVLKDDLSAVLKAVQASDITILASPVYYSDVSAQLKGFIDRTYSYIVSDYADKIGKPGISRLGSNKKFVMILTQNAPEDYFQDIHGRYKDMFTWFLEAKEFLLLREGGFRGGKTLQDCPDLTKRIEALANQLLGN